MEAYTHTGNDWTDRHPRTDLSVRPGCNSPDQAIAQRPQGEAVESLGGLRGWRWRTHPPSHNPPTLTPGGIPMHHWPTLALATLFGVVPCTPLCLLVTEAEGYPGGGGGGSFLKNPFTPPTDPLHSAIACSLTPFYLLGPIPPQNAQLGQASHKWQIDQPSIPIGTKHASAYVIVFFCWGGCSILMHFSAAAQYPHSTPHLILS